jgi:hypothetical protein
MNRLVGPSVGFLVLVSAVMDVGQPALLSGHCTRTSAQAIDNT